MPRCQRRADDLELLNVVFSHRNEPSDDDREWELVAELDAEPAASRYPETARPSTARHVPEARRSLLSIIYYLCANL